MHSLREVSERGAILARNHVALEVDLVSVLRLWVRLELRSSGLLLLVGTNEDEPESKDDEDLEAVADEDGSDAESVRRRLAVDSERSEQSATQREQPR